ncbi:unnamed protein product [Pedinophyceae sp. YPF-701]|nr:unnamed protein product [Pedinophyceae sp. YPF-701]
MRLEVEVPRSVAPLAWLRGQAGAGAAHPRVYFAGRRHATPGGKGTATAEGGAEVVRAVAGIGCAWGWRGADGEEFGRAAWEDMQRFLSATVPALRAYGGMRFSHARPVAPEWQSFGSYLFLVPAVEVSEGPHSTTLSVNLLWDEGSANASRGADAGGVGRGAATAAAAAASALALLEAIGPEEVGGYPALRVQRASHEHVPGRDEWRRTMQPLHDSLDMAGCEMDWAEGVDGLEGPSAGRAANDPAEASVEGSDPADGLTKFVLARRTDIGLEGPPLDPLSLLSALQEKDPRAYQVLLQLPSGDTFLGAPPERLFVRTGRAVASEAVAGTRGRGPPGDEPTDRKLAEELMGCPKEHVEFTVVREWVQRALSQVCGEVKVELPKALLRQQHVQHLYGRLSGELLPGRSDPELLRCLHPTPAVCGQPRGLALQVLEEVEPFDRGWYSAPFGWVGASASEFVVAIRSALVRSPEAGPRDGNGGARTDGGLVHLYAGVGIVRGADAEAEWRELELKTSAFEKLLAPPQALADAANINALWAGMIVEELCRLGVDTFCVAPGSRSSPMAIAAASHPRVRLITCIDERSLAFYALGYGRGRGSPAAVITSSGTAVANLLPAVVEASQSGVPLLLLTADRPGELRDTGANQTIDQVKIFGRYVRWEFDLGPPSGDVRARMALTAVSSAVRRATGPHAGPTHLNLQFREPLAPTVADWPRAVTLEGLRRWEAGTRPFTAPVSLLGPSTGTVGAGPAMHEALATLRGARRGLLVVGALASPEETLAAAEIARRLAWPVYADATSGLRVAGSGGSGLPGTVHHLDHVLLGGKEGVWETVRPDVVLQLGGFLTSKRVGQFLEWATTADGAEPASFLLACASQGRHDPAHVVTHRIEGGAQQLLHVLAAPDRGVLGELDSQYLETLSCLDRVTGLALNSAIGDCDDPHAPITEPRVARKVASQLPGGRGLFLGNSMPIRDVDMYAPRPRDAEEGSSGVGVPVAANRGASGIDGVLSTAVGYAQGLGRGVTLLVGDVSFLHDINGLNLLREARGRPPVTVVVINNSGGGIFSFLPVASAIPKEVFEPVFATPPGVSFEDLCRAHGVPYARAATAAQLDKALDDAWARGEHGIVEVVTDRSENHALHLQLQTIAGRTAGWAGTLARAWMQRNIDPALGALELDVRPYSVGLAKPVTTGVGGGVREGCVVTARLRAASGEVFEGHGEVAPLAGLHTETLSQAVAQLDTLGGLLRDADVSCGRRLPLWAVLAEAGLDEWLCEAIGVAPGSLLPSVAAGFSSAVFAAASAALNVPVTSLLGTCAGLAPTKDALPPVPVCGLLGDTTDIPAACAAAAALAADGHTTIKIKVGREAVAHDIAAVNAIRRAVGDAVALRADANRAWTFADAVEFCAGAAVPSRLEFVEEPLRHTTIGALRDLHRKTGAPVALDESVEEGRLLELSAPGSGVVAAVVKPGWCGGAAATLALARLAAARGIGVVVSSSFETSLGLSHWAALAAVTDAMWAESPAGRSRAAFAHGLGTLSWLTGDVLAEPSGPERGRDGAPRAWSGAAAGVSPLVSDSALARRGPAAQVEEAFHTVHTPAGSLRLRVLSARPNAHVACPGAPILLLHGFLGSADDFLPTLHALGRERRCVAVDLPGHGGSDGLTSGVSVESVADSLAVLSDHLGWRGSEGAVVAGYSMGARVALALTARHPDVVRAVVSISGAPGMSPGAPAVARARRARDAALAEHLSRDGAPSAFLDAWYAQPLFQGLEKHPRFASMLQRRRSALRSPAAAAGVAGALVGLSTGAQVPLWDALGAMAARGALVVSVVGETDDKFREIAAKMSARVVGRGAARRTVQAARGADVSAWAPRSGDVVVVRGAGHAVVEERQELVAVAILRVVEAAEEGHEELEGLDE